MCSPTGLVAFLQRVIVRGHSQITFTSRGGIGTPKMSIFVNVYKAENVNFILRWLKKHT